MYTNFYYTFNNYYFFYLIILLGISYYLRQNYIKELIKKIKKIKAEFFFFLQ